MNCPQLRHQFAQHESTTGYKDNAPGMHLKTGVFPSRKKKYADTFSYSAKIVDYNLYNYSAAAPKTRVTTLETHVSRTHYSPLCGCRGPRRGTRRTREKRETRVSATRTRQMTVRKTRGEAVAERSGGKPRRHLSSFFVGLTEIWRRN
ncbi:hypothetical protein PUN28_012631 [Cardiocondyla obscurior]|uniref:Uncharacterized protein n=1 Tax=Cardiocondyla obscurior TaxID=286306 RepID=A0AAW2FCD8_9HYME